MPFSALARRAVPLLAVGTLVSAPALAGPAPGYHDLRQHHRTAAAGYAAPMIGTRVEVDLRNTTVVRLPRAAAAVVVGDTGVADVAVHSTDTLLILGRRYGRTNVVALDAAGRIISSADIYVNSHAQDTRVRIFAGNGDRETYACGPDCNPAPELGDSEPYRTVFSPVPPVLSDQFVGQGTGGRSAGGFAAPQGPTSLNSVPSGLPSAAGGGAPVSSAPVGSPYPPGFGPSGGGFAQGGQPSRPPS